VEGEGQALQLRIFPNHRGIRFTGRIHEQAIGSLQAKGIPIYACEAAILHHGYEEPQVTVEKLRRNRKLLEEELAQCSEDPNIPFFLARTCSGLGDLELSLTYLDMVLDREKEDPAILAQTAFRLGLFDKANILALLGRVDEALSVLAHGKTLFPQSVLILYLSGKLHFERKEYREAFEDLLPLKDETFKNENAPINIVEVKAWLRRALGVSALFVDEFSVAEECFMEAVRTDPSDMAAYHHLAVTRERKGDLDGAVAACRLGLEQNGEDAYLRKRLFLLLLKGEHFSQALDCYETLNGVSTDVDALAGRFLLSCRALDAVGMQLYYRRLQERLSVAPLDFPQNLQATKNGLMASQESRSIEFFDSAVAFLLKQAA
jgi:tetratricopeptide (TPR) repeat protein